MLTIKDLKANIDNKEILKGLNLEIKPGEVHAIMGPNGSGKSRLCRAAWRQALRVTRQRRVTSKFPANAAFL